VAYQNQKVLLVDDDPNLVQLYATAFKQKQINYSSAKSGAEALAVLKTERPNLILLDVMMPGMNGFEVLMRMKSDPRTKDIPIWMLTNLGEAYGKEKSSEVGAQEYIEKASTSPLIICDKIFNFFEINP
jgi:CheY-like chemotaxis protein